MLRRYRIKSSSGFTIIEMLVAMAIAGIFLGIFIGVVVATFQTLRTGDERTVAQQNARVAMRFLVQDIKQAVEIAPRRLNEPYDPVDGGLPRDENAIDNFDPDINPAFAYPLYRRTTDGDGYYDPADDSPGYIDLYFDGSGGDDDEYSYFRDDGAPYDIRPLAPNRLELLLNTDSFYSHTEYWGDDPKTPDQVPPVPELFEMDLANSGDADNPQALRTRVTYEHQIAPPKVQLYVDEFDGLEKKFRLPVNRANSLWVAVDDEFCIVRSIQTEFFDDELNTFMTTDSEADPRLDVDSYAFRQPLADHIIDVRFRYWHVDTRAGAITANTSMLEIRYDPDISHAEGDPNGGGSPGLVGTDDGYYRYFTRNGQEIFVLWNYDSDSMVEFIDPAIPDLSNIDPFSFIMWSRDDIDDMGPGYEEFDRGTLLFEGWRFINMVSVTIRATNRENLDKFKATINYLDETGDPLVDRQEFDDYKMGFIDFGKDNWPASGMEDRDHPNVFDPFYRAVDSYRTDTRVIEGSFLYDFVEPNVNPNYDPNSFVSIEVFVSPPIVKAIAEQAEGHLRGGFSYKGSD